MTVARLSVQGRLKYARNLEVAGDRGSRWRAASASGRDLTEEHLRHAGFRDVRPSSACKPRADLDAAGVHEGVHVGRHSRVYEERVWQKAILASPRTASAPSTRSTRRWPLIKQILTDVAAAHDMAVYGFVPQWFYTAKLRLQIKPEDEAGARP